MRTSRAVNRMMAFVLMLMIAIGACGCNASIFGKGDKRTAEDFQAEATELSDKIVKAMLSGNFESIEHYFSSADSSEVEQIVTNMDPRIRKESLTTIVSVYTDPDTYATDVQFQISLYFGGRSISTTCYMRLRRSGRNWVVANGGTFSRDLQALNERFVEEKKKEDER